MTYVTMNPMNTVQQGPQNDQQSLQTTKPLQQSPQCAHQVPQQNYVVNLQGSNPATPQSRNKPLPVSTTAVTPEKKIAVTPSIPQQDPKTQTIQKTKFLPLAPPKNVRSTPYPTQPTQPNHSVQAQKTIKPTIGKPILKNNTCENCKNCSGSISSSHVIHRKGGGKTSAQTHKGAMKKGQKKVNEFVNY